MSKKTTWERSAWADLIADSSKLIALFSGMTLFSCTALAHPLDEVVQGAYLTLGPGTLRLELDVTPGTQVYAPVWKALDANGDGQVSTLEGKAYARAVLQKSTLKLNGKTVAWTVERVEVPTLDVLKLGGGTIKIYAVAKRPDALGTHTFSYLNTYQPAKSQWVANVFLQPGGGWAFKVVGQERSSDGKSLTVKYTASK